MPLVSIIIPCYRQGNFLPTTLGSILQQSFTDWECIIVNDGSPDETEEIAHEWIKKDKRFIYVSQNNSGLAAARNKGISISQGSYLLFLDADDLLSSQKLESDIQLFSQTNADIVYSMSYYFQNNMDERFTHRNLHYVEWMPKVSGGKKDILPFLLQNNIMTVCSALIKKTVIEKTGYFETRLKSLEDWDFWIRAALSSSCFQFNSEPESYVLIRVHGESMMGNTLRMHRYDLQLRAKYLSLVDTEYVQFLKEKINWKKSLYKLKSNFSFSSINESFSILLFLFKIYIKIFSIKN
jgi:glycosyltransferase involved in cell wall biosynthesis